MALNLWRNALLVLAWLALRAVADAQTAAGHSAAGYRSPGTNAIACEFARPAGSALVSLLWRPSLPPGWTVVQASGDGAPEAGPGGIVFLGSQLTNNPLRFAYTVAVPAGESGARAVGGEAEYQYDDMWNPEVVRAAPDPLVLQKLYALAVASSRGGAAPPAGTNYIADGTPVVCQVTNSPVASGTRTQHVAYGWTGTGSVPAGGAGTNVTVTLTNDSSITWLWNTQNLIQVTAGANGSVSATGGWYTVGATLAVTAAPAAHHRFAGWSGNVSGLSTNANPLRLTSTVARAISANFTIERHSLVVTSRYGNASPSGSNTYDYGTLVACRVTNAVVPGGAGTQYVAYGWSGTGSVPASGAGTNVAVTLTNNSTLAWLWKTQYWVSATGDGGGSVSPAGEWVDAGSSLVLAATPDSGFVFDRWAGDAPPGAPGPSISVTADAPKSVQALFAVDGSVVFGAQAASGYRTPSTGLVVSCEFRHPADRQLTSLVWSVSLPAGWVLRSAAGGGGPSVVGSEVRFAALPAGNPLAFDCVVEAPGNQGLSNRLSAVAQFGLAGMGTARGASVADLWLTRFHSADYRAPLWSVDETEVNRVVGYWRAGAYRPEPRGFDGFAPTNGVPVPASTNAGLHTADYQDGRWTIDGTELNRVLAYWRSGGYAPDPSGFDGYAAAAAPGLRAADVQDAKPTHAAGPGFDPGGFVVVSNEFSAPADVRSLLWRPRLPTGWRLVGATGSGSVEFRNGEILWLGAMPASPIAMTYTVEVPLWEVRAAELRAEVEYQLAGMVNPSVAEPSPALVLPAVDSDGDGMADGWEQHFGGSPTGMVAGADDDGDGMENSGEYAAGTDPGDAASVLRLDPVVEPAGESFTLSWPSQTSRTYAVSASSDLLQPFVPIATNLPATPPVNTYEDASGEPAAFYAVEVEPP
jgi:hypothetical protein